MKNTNFKQMMRKSAGYTIDQTILIVAVIAILITLIIASVGWDLLNRTSGTKFASYLKQIEEANGTFYARQGVWPNIAVDLSAVAPGGDGTRVNDYISVLAASDPLGAAAPANNLEARWKPYLNGFDLEIVAADTNAIVRHEFGNGGIISQEPTICAGADNDGKAHLEITFEDMPLTELLNADETIDGENDALNGRLTYTNDTDQIQNAVYCGNILD